MKNSSTCTICGNESELETKFEYAEVHRCSSCSHAFSQNIKKSVELVYNDDYFDKNWFLYPNLNLFSRIERAIYEHCGYDGSILDLGCGNGNFLKYLKGKGFKDLHGSDIVDCLLPEIQGEISFRQSDALKLESNEKHQAIVSIANIEHIDDIHGYMGKIRDLLMDGGIVAIYTINESSLIYSIANILDKLGIRFAAKQLYDPHHLNHFSIDSLAALCKKHGLELIDRKTMNYPIKSTDIFGHNFILKKVIMAWIFGINTLSSLLKMEISQLVILKG